jgi:hypothetical protein
MDDGIGGSSNAFDEHLSIGGVKQGKHFGCAIPTIFMRLLQGMSSQFPTVTRIGLGLVRTGFIFTPDAQAQRFAHDIGLFDELFFASLSGSVTTTAPAFRWRTACPV